MRVGIIGLGSIARKHIAALQGLDSRVEIVALRHSPAASSASTEANTTDLYSLDELLAGKPDFIIISNPTAQHYDTVAALAGSDVPLFIEKPLFADLSRPLPTIDSLTYVACNLRFLDCLKWVKEHLGRQRVNEVNAYCGSYLPDWRPDAPDWRAVYSANREMGGGVHIDLIHEIDYLYWLFGRPTRVQKTFRNVSSLHISAWDYANYCLEYPTFAIEVVLNYYRRDYRRTLELVLNDTTWLVNLATNTVTDTCTGTLLFESPQRFADTYNAQMADFLQRLKTTEDKPFNTIDEAYDVLRICLE